MIPGFWRISGVWKWRLTHMNLYRHANALEAAHGEGRESFEIAMDLSLNKAEAGDHRQSWFWWKVANELIRMRQRRALAAEMVRGMLPTEPVLSAAAIVAVDNLRRKNQGVRAETARKPIRQTANASAGP